MPDRAQEALTKKTLVAEWGLSPHEVDDLSARWMQDISLAEHAESYIKQTQRNNTNGPDTRSGLENRSSKQKRIQEAKAKYN